VTGDLAVELRVSRFDEVFTVFVVINCIVHSMMLLQKSSKLVGSCSFTSLYSFLSLIQAMCPLQVFDIEDIGGQQTAVANRPRDCTMCRECIRKEGELLIVYFLLHLCSFDDQFEQIYKLFVSFSFIFPSLPGWSDRIELRRKADHFIFSVESSGCMPPEQIVTEVSVVTLCCVVMYLKFICECC
jgi:hypothetical protein